MYERFTEAARRGMHLAHEEAARLIHDCVGTEHILLGLARSDSPEFNQVITCFGLDSVKIITEIEIIIQAGCGPAIEGTLQHTPRCKNVLEYAMEAARDLNHNYVGTGHLLLGLLMVEDGVAAQVLMNLGLKFDEVKVAVELLSCFDEQESLSPVLERMKAVAGLAGISDIQFFFFFRMLWAASTYSMQDFFSLAKYRAALIQSLPKEVSPEVPPETSAEASE